MKFSERVKNMIRSWLNIQPSPMNTVSLYEAMPFELRTIEAMLWYRGDAAELDQFYKQAGNDNVMRARFWASHTSSSTRKIHTGLPAMMIDTLAYLVKTDMDDVRLQDEDGAKKWKEICESEDFDFTDIVGKGVVGALASGDGAWKISTNREVSEFPIVEFYTADRVEYEVRHGIVYGVDFITDVPYKKRTLKLREKYRKGSVTYELYDADRLLTDDQLREITGLENVDFSKTSEMMLAVPFCIYANPKYPHRGKSILTDKIDDFDALDEIVSQWMHAYRQGRPQKYIPENLIPRDKFDGSLQPHNPFDNEYISVEHSVSETGGDDKIQVVQPEIPYEAFLAGYTNYLDLCLQGILSPATLGIDLGKMSSAAAQREKKDVTGITRNTITGKLEKVLPKLISVVLTAYDIMQNSPVVRYMPEVSFGEYGAPDFDSRVETVNKAAASNTMSIETQVDELWGSSKDEEWKAKEVLRIKRMRGIELTDEPSVGEELDRKATGGTV